VVEGFVGAPLSATSTLWPRTSRVVSLVHPRGEVNLSELPLGPTVYAIVVAWAERIRMLYESASPVEIERLGLAHR